MPLPPYAIALTAGGKVLRFALSAHSGVSTKKGRSVVRLDASLSGDKVVGVETTDGSENVCLATRSARVLIFPVSDVNVVAGAAKGVTAVKIDSTDAVIGFALANRMREGLTVRTNRGATQVVRATRYPVTSRGGRGYSILQRGSLDAVLHDDPVPVPQPRSGRGLLMTTATLLVEPSMRALRRHHRRRMIDRARTSWMYAGMDPAERNRQAVRRHDYLASCSCPMCGNRRRHFGERTWQEQRTAALPLRGRCGRVEDGD